MKKQILRVTIIVLSVSSLSGMMKLPPAQMNYKNIVSGMLLNLINPKPLLVSAYSAPELQELIKSVDALQRDPAEIKSLAIQMMLEEDIVPVLSGGYKTAGSKYDAPKVSGGSFQATGKTCAPQSRRKACTSTSKATRAGSNRKSCFIVSIRANSSSRAAYFFSY